MEMSLSDMVSSFVPTSRYEGPRSTISRAERAKRTAKKKEAKRQRMLQRRK